MEDSKTTQSITTTGIDIQADGAKETPKSTWMIETDGNKTTLTRLRNNRVIENYPPVSTAIASIYIQAIIQGYQPPRHLSHLETPSDQTPPKDQ